MSLPGARRREPHRETVSRSEGMTFSQFHDRVKNMPSLQGGSSGWNRLAVVNRCVTLIGHRLSSLPLRVRGPDGEEVEAPQWLEHPTGTWTGVDLVCASVWSLLMTGNVYVIPVRGDDGEVATLVVPDPGRVDMRKLPGEQGYGYHIGGQRWTGELVHARYATLPSQPQGYSAIAAAAGNVQIAGSAQVYRTNMLEKGLATSYVITSKNAMAPGVAEDLSLQLSEQHAGPDNAFKPLVLEELDLQQVSMTSQEADLQSLVEYNDSQIASLVFGVPPSMVGITQGGSSLTYTNIQDRDTAFWRDTLQPIATRLEALFSALMPEGMTVDLDERRMLMGSVRDRATLLAQLSASRIATLNEMRDLMGLAALPDGDMLPGETAGPADDDGEEADDVENASTLP